MATDYTIPKDEYSALLDENAKLREMCGTLYRLANCACLSERVKCNDCPALGGIPCDLTKVQRSMLELGIEVD